MKKSKKTFDYSNTNWGTIAINSYYTNLQGFELEFLVKNISLFNSKKNIKVLDLGCGGGNVAGFLKKKFPNWEIYGIDISKKAIINANKNYKGIKFLVSGAHSLPFEDNQFDLILSLDTLEHFENYQKVITEISRILKKGGIFYLAVPLEKQFFSIAWILYKIGWTAKNEYVGHVNYFDDKTINSVFRKNGFNNVKSTFAGHFIYQLADLAYFILLKPNQGKKVTFESSLDRPFLLSIKKIFSVATYLESKIFGFLPGARGHYFLKKI